MQVKFFNPGKGYLKIKDRIDAAMQDVLARGDLVLREDGERFEQTLADYVGTAYALGLNSGTDALHLSLKAAGIGPGDEVITISHTFIATIETIVRVGATPILVDVGDDGLMDMDDVAKHITDKTKAVIPVHLEGNVCDMPRLLELQELWHHQFIIIEDAAQALGGMIENQKAGSFGITGCFSFYPAKILGAYGDAGAITTNDKTLYETVKKLRHHAYIGKNMGIENDTVTYGTNSRLDNIQAAVLNVKMEYLPGILDRRKDIAERYCRELLGIEGLELPHKNEGRVWQDFTVRIKNGERDDFDRHMKVQGIETLGAALIPNHTYKGLNLNFSLPKTEQIYKEQVRIPCNENLSDEEVDYVIRKIKEFYG